MQNDIVIQSWGELQEALFQDSWDSSIQRFRASHVFRGLSDSNYELKTSLIRLGGPYASLERHLLRNFKKYGQQVSGHFASIWHLLTMAQHYGLPTRLMDWTYSPYVALHFATANHERFHLDGVIWIVDYHLAHNHLPKLLHQHLENEGAQVFTVELLSSFFRIKAEKGGQEDSAFQEVIVSLENFSNLREDHDFLLFFEPPSWDRRIVNQYALFSIMPNPEMHIDTWLDQHPDMYKRIIIPGELKWEVRDKLDQCNITERVLFPGLDGLSSWLKRHYSPKA